MELGKATDVSARPSKLRNLQHDLYGAKFNRSVGPRVRLHIVYLLWERSVVLCKDLPYLHQSILIACCS